MKEPMNKRMGGYVRVNQSDYCKYIDSVIRDRNNEQNMWLLWCWLCEYGSTLWNGIGYTIDYNGNTYFIDPIIDEVEEDLYELTGIELR